MNYKVGDLVRCKVLTVGENRKIFKGEPSAGADLPEEKFQILHKNEIMQTYMILLKDDMKGGAISTFHTTHLRVSRILLFKPFTDISECHILSQ